jgi:hypothetical protein
MKRRAILVIHSNLTDHVTRLSHRSIRLLHGQDAKTARMEMTFELVRLGWPNTAAILALAAMPAIAISSASSGGIEAARVRPVETAAFCPAATENPMVLRVAALQTVAE